MQGAAADSRLRAHLDRIRLEQTAVISEGYYDRRRAVPRYREVLRDYGVDLAVPEAAAARVRGSRVREPLLAALEDWRRLTTDYERTHLEKVLQLTEPVADAIRAKWWTAVWKGDRATLRTLAADLDVKSLPATTLANMATDLREVNEWAAAERLLRAGRERYLQDFWINFELGGVLTGQKPPRLAEGLFYYEAALALRGPDPIVYTNLSYVMIHAGDLESAIRYCHAALHLDPTFPPAHLNLGTALLRQGDVKGAIGECRVALELDGRCARAHTSLGLALKAAGDLAGAIGEYEAALQLDAEDAPAHNNLGNALSDRKDKGDLEAAIEHFRKAIGLHPDYSDAHYNLAITLNARNDREGAIAHLQTAIRLKKRDAFHYVADHANYADYHYVLGRILEEKGDRAGAIEQYRATIEINPKDIRGHQHLAAALEEKGDLAGGIRALKAVTQIMPKSAAAHFDLATVLGRTGDHDGALAAFETCLKIDPNHADAHNNLGLVLQGKGDRKRAIGEFQAAIKINRKHLMAHFNLGRALEDNQDLQGAIREYETALRINPTSAEPYVALGVIHMRHGRWVEGLRLLKIAHELARGRKDWTYPTARWISQGERLVELDRKLTKVLSDESRLKGAAEAIALARFCQAEKKLYAASYRFYTEAFALEPGLADDRDALHRYNAACMAVMTGCGQGGDGVQREGPERTRLRRQALDWLRIDLAYYGNLTSGAPADVRAFVQKQLQHWIGDTDLAGVRGPQALAELPEAERRAWEKFWADVAETLARAKGSVASEKQSNAK
jgi:tetratricopeptide (TPR) repeat protein